MPEFRYLSSDAGGGYVWKTSVATSQVALERELLSAEIPVLEIWEVNAPVARGSTRGVPDEEKLLLLEQLETAFLVGMPLTRALEMGLSSVKQPFFRKVMQSIREDIDSGLPFSTALARWPGVFSGLERALILAGDQAGIMSEALRQINISLRRAVEIRKKINSLLLYPKILSMVMVIVLGVLLGFTLPRFEGIFLASNVELPALTQGLLTVSRFLGKHPLGTAAAIVVGVWIILSLPAMVRRTLILHRILLRIPAFGPVLRKSIACTFCRTFAQLLSANVSILQALNLCRDITWNAYYRKCVAQTCVLISVGRSISSAIEPMRPVLGDDLTAMLAFGEKTGSISDMLGPLVQRLEHDLSLQVEKMKPAIETMITLVIAVVVGTIVIAAMLPMFDMVKVFSK